MFNQSFIDHWNHHDLTAETVRYWMQDANYQPELDLIAVSGDRKFAAFCDCQLKPQKNAPSGQKTVGLNCWVRDATFGKWV